MADRNTPQTMTLEQWRVEFNELAVDVGDQLSIIHFQELLQIW